MPSEAVANVRSVTARIRADAIELPGALVLPPQPQGVVLFAHGSGSSRLSPRNLAVAARLQEAGLATLLFDLLTETEAVDRTNVFDIGLLSTRMVAAHRWLADRPETAGLGRGFFGASTGAAAALVAAAGIGESIRAIVSRGGRPDLAGPMLGLVRSPTLLIVGGRDEVVLDLNNQARARMTAPTRLEVVPGASHLFEEPGALERVADLAAEWFVTHLPG
jgi:putative phosphoribosyl transferase